MANLLIASLVDPKTHPGGAGTYTRGLVAALRAGPGGHSVTLVGPVHAPPGPWYRSRQALAVARSFVSPLPAKVLFARRRELRSRIRSAARDHDFDAALINGSDMLWILELLPPGMPTILVAHNLEHRLLAQRLAEFGVLSPLVEREVSKQRRYELEGFRRARGAIFVSTAEMAWACAEVAGLRALHVPPLFAGPPAVREPRPGAELRLGFLADFAWWPNRQNWQWLVDEVLPQVRRPLSVHVFGRNSRELPAGDRIVAHGLVPDLGTVWDQVDIMVCPIRAGAGVSVKVAESLYNRMPVLATSQAIRSFQGVGGQGLVVMDDTEDWIEFLNSSEADRLAARVPADDLSRHFGVDEHVARLHDFIEAVSFTLPIPGPLSSGFAP